MKKFFLFLSFVIIGSISFVGCINFMDSENQMDMLNEAVKYANAPYAHVEIKTDPRATLSMIPAVGVYNIYKVTDSIPLNFEENDDYIFKGWKCTPEKAIHFENSKERSTKATILSAEENIIIEPYTLLRDTLKVNFDWEEGSVSAPYKNSFKQDEEFSFRYNSIPDYAFIGWKVYGEDGKERNDIIEFFENGIDARVKVLKVNEIVTVKPVIVKRPKVVSNSPLFSSDGVYRDRRIVVMFDQDMDESSIYYDADEQEKLKADGKKPIFDTAEGRTDKCYAYTDKDGLHWKNITIELRRIGTRYEEYYNAPYFDENDKSVLYIDPDQDNPPPGGKEILVTLKQKMVSKDETELSGEFSWAYFTNGSIDLYGPEFGSNFEVIFEGNENKPQAVDIKDTNKYPDIKINTDEKIKMKFKGEYVDNGSGAGDLWYEVVQVESPYYTYTKENPGRLPSGTVETEKAKMKATVDPDDVIEIDTSTFDEGIYRIDIKAFDLNQKPTLFNEYYFIKDNTEPQVNEYGAPWFGTLDNGVKIAIDLSYEGFKDLKKIVITGSNNEEIPIGDEKLIKRNYAAQNYNGNTWSANIDFVDYAGNVNKCEIYIDVGILPGCYYIVNKYGEHFFIKQIDYSPEVDLLGVVVGEPGEYVSEDVRIYKNSFYTPSIANAYSVCKYQSNDFSYVITESTDGFDFYEKVVNLYKDYMTQYYPLYYDLYYKKNDWNKSSILWYVPSLQELYWLFEVNKNILDNYMQGIQIDFAEKKVISCYIDEQLHCINYLKEDGTHGWIELREYHNHASDYSILLMGRVPLEKCE